MLVRIFMIRARWRGVLVFATGPLTSDIISQSDRVSIEFISPPTGIWGSIYVGTRRTFVTEDFKVGVKN